MMSANKTPVILFLLFSLCTTAGAGPGDTGHPGYPAPERSGRLLFYVQRPHNRNTVVYELNLTPDGTPDAKEPLHASWIRYEEGGIRKELTYVQTRVYGLDVRPLASDHFVVKFRQYKKREIFLMRSGKTGAYKALMRINGRMAELASLFIGSVTNALGVPSAVKYIDIYGFDPASGQPVHEHVILSQ